MTERGAAAVVDAGNESQGAVDSATYTSSITNPPGWLGWAGVLAIIGAVAAIVADVTAISLDPGRSFLATSVSATAVGDHSWFVDGAIYLTGGGIGALAFGFHFWNLDHGRYRFGIFCLAALALTIVLLAGWDAYNPDQVPDFGFHMMLVYGLSALFPLAALTLARALFKISRFWGAFSISLALLWLVAGPVYAFTPEELEGLFQRIAFALLLFWVGGVGVLFLRVAGRTKAENRQLRARAQHSPR